MPKQTRLPSLTVSINGHTLKVSATLLSYIPDDLIKEGLRLAPKSDQRIRELSTALPQEVEGANIQRITDDNVIKIRQRSPC